MIRQQRVAFLKVNGAFLKLFHVKINFSKTILELLSHGKGNSISVKDVQVSLFDSTLISCTSSSVVVLFIFSKTFSKDPTRIPFSFNSD